MLLPNISGAWALRGLTSTRHLIQKLALCVTAVLIVSCSHSALADTLYVYSGPDFSSATGFFTSSDHVVASFTLAGGPVVCLTGCFVDPTGFFLAGVSDGAFFETSFISPPDHIFLQTNVSGGIVQWRFNLCLALDDCLNIVTSGGVATANGFFGGDFAIVGNSIGFSGGSATWTVTTIPEPATCIMFASGLALLGGKLRWRKGLLT